LLAAAGASEENGKMLVVPARAVAKTAAGTITASRTTEAPPMAGIAATAPKQAAGAKDAVEKLF
jgi:hypothetical protein